MWHNGLAITLSTNQNRECKLVCCHNSVELKKTTTINNEKHLSATRVGIKVYEGQWQTCAIDCRMIPIRIASIPQCLGCRFSQCGKMWFFPPIAKRRAKSYTKHCKSIFFRLCFIGFRSLGCHIVTTLLSMIRQAEQKQKSGKIAIVWRETMVVLVSMYSCWPFIPEIVQLCPKRASYSGGFPGQPLFS